MKRILALFLAAVLLLSCQGGGQSAAPLAMETAIPTDAPQIRLLSEHEGGLRQLWSGEC